MNRGRKELKPLILKAGFALLLSLAGIFAARHHHRRRRRRSISPPPTLLLHLSDLETELSSSAGEGLPMHQNVEALAEISPRPLHLSDLETELGSSAGILSEELPMHQNEVALAKISPPAPVTVEQDRLSSSESFCKEEEFFAAPLTDNFEFNDSVAMAEEIKNLRSLVQFHQEREVCLEMKLLEFHGLKEQEVLMRELQNRLKISATETKLLFLKIESLKAENEKLREEASDYSRVVSELELQKKNVAVLESKLTSVGEQVKEKIAVLHGRINELREKEKKDLEDSVEIEKKLKLFNEMENSRTLSLSALRSPDSVLKSQEFGTLEEQNQLREENENLKKKLEQLHSDHCEDVEELVYLRWINACLRYELRNYQPLPGRTVARDLSRSLSPKSEQKAKQLILDYSNPHLNSNRSISIDFDLDDCSSQTSSEEFDVASLDSSKTKSSNSSKSKLFNKLKKLVLGKGRSEEKTAMTTASDLNSERKASVSTCGVNDCRRRSFGSALGLSIERRDNSAGMEFNGSEKWQIKRNHSHDIQNLRRINHEEVSGGMMPERCNSDLGVVPGHKRMPSLNESSTYRRFVEDEEGDEPEKEKLKKFAQVFRDSQGSLRSKRLV